jgi:hypothetical protein
MIFAVLADTVGNVRQYLLGCALDKDAPPLCLAQEFRQALFRSQLKETKAVAEQQPTLQAGRSPLNKEES